VSRVALVPPSHHRRIRNCLKVGALVLFGALPAAAQDVDPLARLDQNSRFAIDLMVDSARVAGLPTAPLLSRALEGISRKVDSRKIVEAVRKQLSYLKIARSVLGGVGEEELVAAAAVVEAGTEAVRRISTHVADRHYPVVSVHRLSGPCGQARRASDR
jgi:hypothetical protein